MTHDVCTKCGEPFAEIEEQLSTGFGSHHRGVCPTLADWRRQAEGFARIIRLRVEQVTELDAEIREWRRLAAIIVGGHRRPSAVPPSEWYGALDAMTKLLGDEQK